MKTGKILVIDDMSNHLLLLQSILEEDKYNVDIADNPETALAIIQEKKFNIILLDIMMPRMDGYEVLEKLKSNEDTAKIPVIIISAKTDSWSIKNAMDKGAFDYITKPINVFDVRNKVKTALAEE